MFVSVIMIVAWFRIAKHDWLLITYSVSLGLAAVTILAGEGLRTIDYYSIFIALTILITALLLWKLAEKHLNWFFWLPLCYVVAVGPSILILRYQPYIERLLWILAVSTLTLSICIILRYLRGIALTTGAFILAALEEALSVAAKSTKWAVALAVGLLVVVTTGVLAFKASKQKANSPNLPE
jgi:hypothetical protein